MAAIQLAASQAELPEGRNDGCGFARGDHSQPRDMF